MSRSEASTPNLAAKRDLLSSFPDVFNLFGQEKSFKQAIYSTATILLVLVVSFAVVAVYFVMEPFLRPLVWAVLFGSVLHPFKKSLTQVSRDWLSELRINKQPISLGCINLPFNLLNWILDGVIKVMIEYSKLLIFILVLSLTIHLLIYYFTFTHQLYTLIGNLILSIKLLVINVHTASSSYIVGALIVSHLIIITFWWSSLTKRILIISSPIVWIMTLSHLVVYLGHFGVISIIIVSSLFTIGFIKSIFLSQTSSESGDETDSNVKNISLKLLSFVKCLKYYLKCLLPANAFINNGYLGQSIEANPDDVDHPSNSIDNEICVSKPVKKPFKNRVITQRNQLSNVYLYALVWSCMLAQIWLRPHILYLLPLPIALIIIRWFWKYLCHHDFVINQINKMKSWVEDRNEALIHPGFKTVCDYMLIGDNVIIESLERSIDTFSSISVILLMIVSILFAAVFLSIQVYGESSHLVEIISNVVNTTIARNPELSQMFPEGLYEHGLLDDMIGNAYLYGRKWLKNTVRHVLQGDVNKDSENANATRAIEKQLLEVWDRIYHLWLVRNTNDSDYEFASPLVKSARDIKPYNWNKLVDALKTLNLTLCFNMVKENIDTLISVFESVWTLLKGNVTLLMSAVTAVLSILLGGSSAILNFFLSFIVFSTSLFYLLSLSGDLYKPIELASRLLPQTNRSTNKIGKAFEEAVNSVFAASFKMMAFYGLYTWLIHTLFLCRVVYIPSVIGALFGAVPFLGAYWASIPAALELWLIHGQKGKSFLMVIFALLPSYFVDSAIYSEIKGAGHPYLTGLAIAGGVFYLGFEGAVIGPIMLCCLFVAVNMFTSIMEEGNCDSGTQRQGRPVLKRMLTSID